MPAKLNLSFRPKTYWPAAKSVRGAQPDTEIARIAISSASRDAIILRARRNSSGRIGFSLVHEDAYGRTRHRIRVRPASSAGPLSLGELIALLESACYAGPCPDEGDEERYGGVIWGTLQLSLEHGVDHADDYLFFLKITSRQYRQLERYYIQRVSEWCLENCVEEEDCRKIVRLRTGRFPRKVVRLGAG